MYILLIEPDDYIFVLEFKWNHATSIRNGKNIFLLMNVFRRIA